MLSVVATAESEVLGSLAALWPGGEVDLPRALFLVDAKHESYCGWTESCTTSKPWETIVHWHLQDGCQGLTPSRADFPILASAI